MELKKIIIGVFLLLLVPFASNAGEKLMIWQLGGDLELQFQSDVSFEFDQKEAIMLAAHLPGFSPFLKNALTSSLVIEHTYSVVESKLIQHSGNILITSAWKGTFPPDFIHLAYGAARLEWLHQGIFPVHAACIGNETDGYTLLMGNPGCGKTTLTLESVLKHGFRVFSGDKTLLRFNENHELVAIAGTRIITIRSEDVSRWSVLQKVVEQEFVDRLAFELTPACYANEDQVTIKRILLVGLNDGINSTFQLSPRSALHALYPYFLDKQREDILIEGDSSFLDGAVDKDVRKKLAKNLKSALDSIPVFKVIGSVEKVSEFIAGKDDE